MDFSCVSHNCQYRTIHDTYRTIHIVSCVKSSVSYLHIVSVHESYDTICVSYKLYHIVKLYVSYDT